MSFVAHCVESGEDLAGLSQKTLQQFHPAFNAGADTLLDAEQSFARRDLPGATARVRVEAAVEAARTEIDGIRERLEGESGP